MKSQKRRFVSPNDVETQVFDWGYLKWMSEPRVTEAEKFSAGVVIARLMVQRRHGCPALEQCQLVGAELPASRNDPRRRESQRFPDSSTVTGSCRNRVPAVPPAGAAPQCGGV